MEKNYMKLEFLSKSSNESFARVVVAAFASQIDPTLEEISDIKTAVSEAVTNAIIHGYEFNVGTIYLEASIEDNVLELIIKDNGRGIDDIKKAMEPFYTSKPDLERSGMGFTVMELSVESVKEVGTTVKMRKKIKTSIDKE